MLLQVLVAEWESEKEWVAELEMVLEMELVWENQGTKYLRKDRKCLQRCNTHQDCCTKSALPHTLHNNIYHQQQCQWRPGESKPLGP